MKVYNLNCKHDHRFEGWFASEQDFLDQAAQNRIECPMCGNHQVARLPSAPRLNLSGNRGEQVPTPSTAVEAVLPDAQLEQQWMAVAKAIVENTEDVGERFAEEARRIHYKETEARAIRGVASLKESQALAEEGISVVPFALPTALKHTLQ